MRKLSKKAVEDIKANAVIDKEVHFGYFIWKYDTDRETIMNILSKK